MPFPPREVMAGIPENGGTCGVQQDSPADSQTFPPEEKISRLLSVNEIEPM